MGPRRRTGLRWRRLLGCGLPSGTPGIIALCWSRLWEMEPGGREGSAARASCTFCIPTMVALWFYGALARRRWKGCLWGAGRAATRGRGGCPRSCGGLGLRRSPGAASGSLEAAQSGCLVSAPTTFANPSGAGRETTRRAWAGVLPERMPPRGTRRDGCFCSLVCYVPLAQFACFAFCVLRLIGRPVAASAGSTICASVRLTPLVFAASLHEQIS